MSTDCSKEIKCSIHPTYNIQFALLKKNESNQAFYCSLCILQQKIDNKYLISIDNATRQASTEPIFNWPLGINQNIISYLQDCSSNNKKEQIKQKIEEYYEDLEQQIISQLKESKRQALNDLESSSALKSDLINIYNYEFKRNELKDLLNQNTKCIDDEYWDIINKVDESKDKVFRELEEKIKSIAYIQNQLEKGTPYMMKQVLNQLTKQINFFEISPNPNPNPTENSRQDKKQQPENINNFNEIIQIIFERVQHELKNKSQIEQNLQERNNEYLKIKRDIQELILKLKRDKKIKLSTLSSLSYNIKQIQSQLISYDNLKIEEFNFLDNVQQTKRSIVIKNLLHQYQNLDQIDQDKIENYLSHEEKKQNVFKEIIDNNNLSSNLNQVQKKEQGLFSNLQQLNTTNLPIQLPTSLFSNLNQVQKNESVSDNAQQTQSSQKQEISKDNSGIFSKQNQFKQKNTFNFLGNSQQTQIKQELSSDKPIQISNQNQLIKNDFGNQLSTQIDQKQGLFSNSLLSNINQLKPNTTIQSNSQQEKIQQKQELSSDKPNLISNQNQVQKSDTGNSQQPQNNQNQKISSNNPFSDIFQNQVKTNDLNIFGRFQPQFNQQQQVFQEPKSNSGLFGVKPLSNLTKNNNSSILNQNQDQKNGSLFPFQIQKQ
ncbi:hypothetical protein ABPG73_000849 [Tetrahymena malaccensis]